VRSPVRTEVRADVRAKAFPKGFSGCRESPRPPDGTEGLGTETDQVHPRFARAVRQANCFQSIFGSQTSLDFIILSQVTSSPV
jgi:hypothetical protein